MSFALETAARARPAGHTMVMVTGTHTARRAAHQGNLSHHLLKDFTAVARMARQSHVPVLPGVAAKPIPELLALVKAEPRGNSGDGRQHPQPRDYGCPADAGNAGALQG